MPGSSTVSVARDDVGLLVRLEADSMAGAVDEQVAVAGVAQDRPAHLVDGLGGHARARVDTLRLLSLDQHGVCLEVLGRGRIPRRRSSASSPSSSPTASCRQCRRPRDRRPR